MPKFKITDSVTGKTVIVSGDSAPSHDDAEQIFKDAGLRDQPKAEPPPMSMGDMASQAASNFIPSAVNLGKNIVTPVLHPVDTAKSIYHLGAGIIEKAIPGQQADEETANAVGKYFADRYGGIENIKRAIATDPAGVMADASIVLGGGAGALKAAGATGKIAGALDKAGEIANPVSLGIGAARGAGNLFGKGLTEALGVTTGAGPQSIRTAFNAGAAGGPAATAFQENLRGIRPIDQIVDDAKRGISNLEANRGAEYRAGMGGVNSDPAVLSLSPIDAAISQGNSINNFKGIDLSPETAGIRQKIGDTIELWRKQDPAEFHTAAGFDALKKAVGNIRDTTQYGTPERVVADKAYNAIKTEVANQAPVYADTMKNYANASDRINELRSTFSLGEGKQRDTAIRKLQSSLRDNVNTSYGRRTALAEELAKAGAPNLLESIAGQTLAPNTPRSLGKVLAGGEVAGMVPLLAHGDFTTAAAVAPMLALQSPRLVGEGAYYAGKGAGAMRGIGDKSKAAKAALIARLLGEERNNQQQGSATLLGSMLVGNQ